VKINTTKLVKKNPCVAPSRAFIRNQIEKLIQFINPLLQNSSDSPLRLGSSKTPTQRSPAEDEDGLEVVNAAVWRTGSFN